MRTAFKHSKQRIQFLILEQEWKSNHSVLYGPAMNRVYMVIFK